MSTGIIGENFSRPIVNRAGFTEALGGALMGSAAAVAGKTWSGLGGGNNWSTGANWVGGAAPVAGENIVFTGSTRLAPVYNIANGSPSHFPSIIFDASASSFTLSWDSANSFGAETADGLVRNSSGVLQTLDVLYGAEANRTVMFDCASGDILYDDLGAGGALQAYGTPAFFVKSGSGTLTFGANISLALLVPTGGGSFTVNAGVLHLAHTVNPTCPEVFVVSGGMLSGISPVSITGGVTVANVSGSKIAAGTAGVPSTLNLTTGNLVFGGVNAKLFVNTNGVASASQITCITNTVTLGGMTVDFDATQALNAGSYTLITSASMSGSVVQGALPIGRTWGSLSIVSNNLVAVLV